MLKFISKPQAYPHKREAELRAEDFAEIADRYAGAIIDQCEKLENFPFRGSARDEVRPGLRTISFRRRVTIAYSVIDEHVTILGVYSGGQDFATLLAGDHFSK
jgi:plasmid stabilization system protein ParE